MINKNSFCIKMFVILVFFATLYIFPFQNGFSEEKIPSIDWKNIRKNWDEFIEYPSSENLKKVFLLMPYMSRKKYNPTQRSIMFGGSGDAVERMVKDIWLLEKEAYSGNKWAVKVLHKLLTLGGRWDRHKLLTILGNLIRINPHLFLEEMSQQIDNIDGDDFKLILRYLDVVYYTDKTKARYREIDLRIKALERVKTDSLKTIKEKCLEVLMEKRKMYKKIVARQ